jgi:hypothetical protein
MALATPMVPICVSGLLPRQQSGATADLRLRPLPRQQSSTTAAQSISAGTMASTAIEHQGRFASQAFCLVPALPSHIDAASLADPSSGDGRRPPLTEPLQAPYGDCGGYDSSGQYGHDRLKRLHPCAPTAIEYHAWHHSVAPPASHRPAKLRLACSVPG